MRIAIDSTAILGHMSRNRGIGNYAMGQYPKMIELDDENEYYFFNLYDEEFELNDYIYTDNKKFKETKLYFGHDAYLCNKNYQLLHEILIKKYLRENEIDVFVITSPFDDRGILYKKEWFTNIKVVMIVYDIIPYVLQKHYFPHGNGMEWYLERIKMIGWADQIQVISQSVKDDLVSYLDFDENKIEVIWGAVDKRFKEIEISESTKSELYKKFNIQKDFIMCTGGDDERKNISGLITAYSQMKPEIKEKYQLVIVCKLSPNALERYTELSKKLNCLGDVVFTNFVSNEELIQFYNLATIMAFPSLYEGFGLPVVEAWACGTNVLTSNNSSLVQIAGDAAIVVDAKDIKSITKGLEYALTDCDKDAMMLRAKKRLELFQWDKVATSSIEGINKLKSSKNVEDKCDGRKKIAMFTPLPPVQSGIADYSMDIVNELINYMDIDIFIDDNYKVECSLDSRIRVFSHSKFEKHKSEYYETVYQVGNSEFHIYMYDYIKKYSGVVVLHDYNMHGVAIHAALVQGKHNYKQFLNYLLEDYEQNEAKAYVNSLKQNTSGYRIYEMELNGFITNYAKKIIVHSFESKKKLLMKNYERNVKQIWHYAKVDDKCGDNTLLKRQYGYNEDDIIIAAFGHVHSTKRIIPIIHAFKMIREENENVKLLFVGKLADEIKSAFNSTVKEYGLKDSIKVTGYIEIEDFIQYIDLTDICLNLRYPYNGETSGSLMRIFAKGKCVIVNDVGSFSEFPDDACIKLPPVEEMTEEEEIDHIYEALNNVINDKVKRDEISENAYLFAKNNLDLSLVAKQYADFILAENETRLSDEIIEQISAELNDKVELAKVTSMLEYII